MIEPIFLAHYSFQEVAKALQHLTEDQFLALSDGRARIELHFDEVVVEVPLKKPTTRGPVKAAAAASPPKLTPVLAAEAIRTMISSEQVANYLKANERALTKEKIVELAALLGPTVALRSGGTKSQLFTDIVSGTAGFREDSELMLPGGFR